jgi:hypothetical protein
MKQDEQATVRFDPWVGPEYGRTTPKIMVLGESRYDEEFTDRRIIEWRIEQRFSGGQRRTFTNFEHAILGQGRSEEEAGSFWRRAIFYNYNQSFYPGEPRIRLEYAKRLHPQNPITLRSMLTTFKPTHVIVWGVGNWDSIDAGNEWKDGIIPNSSEPYGACTVEGHTALFTRVRHPSTAFRSIYWHPVLTQFLALRA